MGSVGPIGDGATRGLGQHDVLARPDRVVAQLLGQPGQAHGGIGSVDRTCIESEHSELHGGGR